MLGPFAREGGGPPAEVPVTPVRVGDMVARQVQSASDAALLAVVLRRKRRWHELGLARPPTQRFLTVPVAVRRPSADTEVRLAATVVFSVSPSPHIVAVALDWAWARGEQRTRLAEAFLVDERETVRAVRADILAAACALWFGPRRAYAVRCAAGGELAGWLELAGVGRALDVEGQALVHLAAAEARKLSQGAEPVDHIAIVDSDRAVLGAFGAGGWPTAAMVKAAVSKQASPEIRVRDPSVAHRQLLAGSSLARRAFFPAREPPEELDVVILGGGISGLTAAHELSAAGRRCAVLERADRIGGTGAWFDGLDGPVALAAHYEHDPCVGWGDELLGFYQRLGWVQREPQGQLFRFVDREHYIDAGQQEQGILPDGTYRRAGWQLFTEDSTAVRLRDCALEVGFVPTPTRLADDALRELNRQSMRAWMGARHVPLSGEVLRSLDVIFASDYGAGADTISAFAGLHYFLNRPHLEGDVDVGTFSPPQGLGWFADRIAQRLPDGVIRLQQMGRRVRDRGDHVEVLALDLAAGVGREYRARAAVVACPKNAVRLLFRPDARLFSSNRYAAWVTVIFELEEIAEKELLCWANHVAEPTGTHIGFTWANHAASDAPPVLAHYIALPPGPTSHLRLLFGRTQPLIRRCLEHMRVLLGRDVSEAVRRITIQKLGHSMPTPVVGGLFFDPNARRTSERIVYAGVDTGRIPILAEAIDSGLEAAQALSPLLAET